MTRDELRAKVDASVTRALGHPWLLTNFQKQMLPAVTELLDDDAIADKLLAIMEQRNADAPGFCPD